MMKKIFIISIFTLFILSSINATSLLHTSYSKINRTNKNTTLLSDTGHAILVEEGTATYCHACPKISEALYNLYKSGKYDFYFVALIADKNDVAMNRLKGDYNIYGFPTCFFDGGYKVVVSGSENDLENAIKDCLNRNNMRNINLELNAIWKGNAVINISISVRNNEDKEYNGFLRVYITEISSRWKDHSGEPYHFGFLDFAINETISIQGGKKLTKNVTWDGKEKNYGDIEKDNIMVIASVFNGEKHTGYARPPDKNPFDAYYVDATVGKKPEKEVKPATLKGYVKDKKGNTIENAKVSIKNEKYEKNTNTDKNGYYEIKNIYPGSYTLKAEKTNYKVFTKNLQLNEGETHWQNITLLPQKTIATLKGFILDKITEKPIKDVKVTLYNNTDEFVEYTDEIGYYEIKISPGTYTIKLEKMDYKSYTDTLQLPKEGVYWYNKSLQPLNIPPQIKINKPEYGRLYIEDRDVLPFLAGKIFVIGKITISVSAFSQVGIDRVEFRIDDGPKLVDRKPPYEKLWWYSTIGKHVVTIKAYDKNGLSNEIYLEIVKIG